MAEMKILLTLVIVALLGSLGSISVQALTHHVVGGNRGWDPSSNLSSWSHARIFTVGDKIWFMYSAAHGNIAEVKTLKEYESCDVKEPIRMLSNGLEAISLDGEGMRYFASSDSNNCNNHGLKLHLEVLPPPKKLARATNAMDAASGPAVPSGVTEKRISCLVFGAVLFISVMGVAV